MDKGYSVVVGMTLAYAVSFFGLLLAYIVYQRNHNKNDLWRKRPVGVSFFAALYGFIIPLILLANAVLTLMIKLFKGWDFNSFVWTNEALIWPLPAGALLFWLIGRMFWNVKTAGYIAALIICSVSSLELIYLTITNISMGAADLFTIGSCITGLIWHVLWAAYFIRSTVRGLFFIKSHA